MFAAIADHFFRLQRLALDFTLREIIALPFLSDGLLVGIPFPSRPFRDIRMPNPPPLKTLKWQSPQATFLPLLSTSSSRSRVLYSLPSTHFCYRHGRRRLDNPPPAS